MATIAERLAEAAILDTLVRTENPLAAAEWTKWGGATAIGKCENGVATAREGYSAVTSFVGGEDGAYWNAGAFKVTASDYVYVMAAVGDLPASNERRAYLVCLRPSPGGDADGYVLRMERRSSTQRRFKLERWVNGGVTVLDEIETTTYGLNSRFAIVVHGGKVMVWASVTGVSEFTELLKGEDSTYTEGFSGLRSKGTGEWASKDFATGTFTLKEEGGGGKGTVKVKVGGVVKAVKRWVKTAGGLVNA